MTEQTFDNRFPSDPSEADERDFQDLGFGAVVARESRQRLLNRDGSFNVSRRGFGRFTSLNLYHTLMTMSWSKFLGLILILYFVSNIFFGFLYSSLGPQGVVDVSNDPTMGLYLRGFFFSVQTFATIGYGTIHPVGLVPNLLVTIESYYSLLANALITGLVFARFARPTAKVIYSDVAVVAPYDGITGFMFRLVNGRNNQLIEVHAKVLFARFVREKGAVVRRFDSLNLERKSVTFFPLTWTVVHPINEHSPMYGLTWQDLVDADAEVFILLTATDETFSQIVHSRTSYKPVEIKFGHKFANVYNQARDDEPLTIDVGKLSKIEKIQ